MICAYRTEYLDAVAEPGEECLRRGCGGAAYRRGLCRACYRTWLRLERAAGRFLGLPLMTTGHGRRQPDEPTGAAPGTPEKVDVIIRRLRSGQDLWHPRDRRE